MKTKPYTRERGQILLITLLVLAFAVTVTLSLVARTTSDVSITSQTEDSAKAFSAAEAGIEAGLASAGATGIIGAVSGGVNYTSDVTTIGGETGTITYPGVTTDGTTETVWLVNHNPTDGTVDETQAFTGTYLDVCWNKPATTAPAVAVSIFYKRGGAYYVAKGAYDPDATRNAINKFADPTSKNTDAECGSSDYRTRLTFSGFGIDPVADTLLMVRVRPVYADTVFSISSPVTLPLQGKQVVATGSTSSGATRKIIVFQQYRSADTLFESALYSQTNLVK